MPNESVSLAEENLFSIFGQRDAELRKIAVKRLWKSECVFVDDEHTHRGQTEVASAAGALLARYPEYEFWALDMADYVSGVYRLRWAFGTAGLAPALTGEDVVRIEGQKIVAVYRFLNGAAF